MMVTNIGFWSRCWLYISKPFWVIKKSPGSFALWLIITMIVSNMKLIINLVVMTNIGNLSFYEALKANYSSGYFYTFAIVLVATPVCSMLTSIFKVKNIEFKKPKIFLIIIGILFLVLCALYYALFLVNQIIHNGSLSYSQGAFFMVSLAFSVYASCVIFLDPTDVAFKELMDVYDEEETKNVEQMQEKSKEQTTDGKNKL